MQEIFNQKMYHCQMNWKKLIDLQQLEEIDQITNAKGVMIFKHSTRCSISDTAKSRIERTWKIEDDSLLVPYYLDLIVYRSISNTIADRYQIAHESPQVLIIYKGKCIFSQTHLSISMQDILQSLPK
ncbi:MAG: bacillithiol system redox-active protein YtxJ [Chitinophagales bacterium]